MTTERFVNRRAWTVFGIFACACLVSLILKARAKPFWHDEIYTILHAGLPSLGAMWSAAIDGFDLSPPLNTWLTRVVHSVAGVGHVTTRIVPMAGFLAMTALVFHMLRTRANMTTALAGALLPCFTSAYRYSYEARGYGLMVGLFALALFAWTEAARGVPRRRRFYLCLLAASLSATLWNHYYGLLTFIPIVGGEAIRTIQRRKVDVGVLASIGVAILSMVPLRPLAAAARTQSEWFWSTAASTNVSDTYRFVFSPLMERHLGVAAVLIAGLLLFPRPRRAAGEARTLPAHEIGAGLLSLLVPAIGVAIGLLLTGVFVPRYVLSAVVGFSLVVPLAVWLRDTRWAIAELLLCGVLAVSFGLEVARTVLSPPALLDPFMTRPLLREAVTTGPPVVVASSLQFLQYWYYTPAAHKSRLRYLADVESARTHMQSDTIDRGYLALRRWTAVPVEPYDTYAAGHAEYRVYVAGSGWLLARLAEAGATIQELGSAPAERLVLVQVPRQPER